VTDANPIRDFYAEVAGWQPQAVSMGEYEDYNMLPEDGEQPSAGICHARGKNAALPPQWIIYITVKDLDQSIDRIRALGGEIIDVRRQDDSTGFCVFRDPAGAVAAVFQPEA
jgi:predicted enzyme related to lactoylglutathione lyase